MPNNKFNDYSNYLQKPVEINTLLSSTPILGEVIEADDNSITIAPNLSNSGSDYYRSTTDKENTYYVPHNSILSMKEI